MAITADVLRIRDVFAQGADLRVPPFQRGFAWTKKEIGALLRDLFEAFDLPTIYFLGAMVVIQPRNRSTADVVDGQQRLSTLTIILAVLRDLTDSADEASSLHGMIGHEAIRWGDRHRWRITLNTQDAAFFRSNIQTRNATRRLIEMGEEMDPSWTESQQRLVQAVRQVHEPFGEMSEEDRTRFVRWLFDEVSVVKVRVTEVNVGYKVFLVLNQRGKQLSDHDIIKSALFERAGFRPDEANQHSHRWNQYATQLGAEHFEGMLKQVRFLYDEKMKGEFIDGLLQAIMNRMPVGVFINDKLPRFVSAYDAIDNGKTEQLQLGPEVERSLAHLRNIQHEGWRAPAIKYLTEGVLERESAAKFFASLERLSFFLQYCVKERDYRTKRYRRLVEHMDTPLAKGDGPSPLDLAPDEKAAIIERLSGRFQSPKQRKAMLMRISAAAPGGVPLDPEADATVEHILPRTPLKGSDWYEEWSRARDREDLTECIGNFTLLTHDENQAADRKAFVQKVNIYFRNGGQPSFAISHDLKGRTKWTPDDVRARRELLIGYLAKEWGL